MKTLSVLIYSFIRSVHGQSRNDQCLTEKKPGNVSVICGYELKSIVLSALLCASQSVSAEEWYDIDAGPKGKIAHAPLQLEKYPLGGNTEQHISPNQEFTLWIQDETLFKPKEEDTVEIKKVLNKEVETFKLKDAVPAIGFKSGNVDIPDDYIERLRDVLKEMKNRKNVRLHFSASSL